MPVHEYYDELCALAAAGDLRHEEWTELEAHLQTCSECRKAVGGYADLYLRMVAEAEDQFPTSVPEGMTRRFVARARSAGIPLAPLSSETRRGTPIPWPFQLGGARVFGIAVVILVIATGSFFLGSHFEVRRSSDRPASAASPIVPPARKASRNA